MRKNMSVMLTYWSALMSDVLVSCQSVANVHLTHVQAAGTEYYVVYSDTCRSPEQQLGC
jgi:hypothetical protein